MLWARTLTRVMFNATVLVAPLSLPEKRRAKSGGISSDAAEGKGGVGEGEKEDGVGYMKRV